MPSAAKYLDDTRDIEGWLFPIDAYLFAAFNSMQKRMGIRGNLFEIGVHHGKTAILFAWMVEPDEILGVCDIFDQQHLNADGSGRGDRAVLTANMRRYGPSGVSIRVFEKLSFDLTSCDTTNNCRFFHIDGGHRPEDVVCDLGKAALALSPQGIVAVDDPFNPNWPGVSEGLYRFFSKTPDTFTPVMIGGNKAYFSRPAMASAYRVTSLPDDVPYTLGEKQWLGTSVLTALRLSWVDLDPWKAARQHLRPQSHRDRLRRYLLQIF
jgi:hypothetical protein